MKKYTLVSTYPQNGSKNIGDALITFATIEAIKEAKGEEEIFFNIVWRAEKWENIKDSVLASDVVIFACLAIRNNMTEVEYPYLKDVINSGLPIAVLSAGTSLNFTEQANLYNSVTSETREALLKINNQAIFFSTRGLLSQAFCEKQELDHVRFCGDIAFYDKRFNERKFKRLENVNRIAISDPHYPEVFLKSFEKLCLEVKYIFPDAEIVVLLHGINKTIERFCSQNNIKFEEIFLDKESGLDRYDDYDIHIGYRVHAHVSMLKRRKPSYLIEQDGRGIDYGLTLERKISIPSVPSEKLVINFKNILRWMLGKKLKRIREADPNVVNLLISIVKSDKMNCFQRFFGLENQILKTVQHNLFLLRKLP